MVASLQRLDYRELSGYKSLFLDYLHRFERLAPFYAAPPGKSESWRETAQAVERYPHNYTRVAEALETTNRTLGADGPALQAVDALRSGALAIVTGQQVGLLGGPLYTLYKALTAVELARRASERLGRVVVALFWMDADDHDFEEVRHVRLLSTSHDVVTLTYEPDGASDRVPVAWHPLGPSIEAMIGQAGASIPPSEFKNEVLDGLRQSYAAGQSLAAAFGSWLLRMTRGTGLAVVDPTVRELKALAAPLFEREAVEKSESSRLVRETTERLLSLGYHAQAATTSERLNMFYAAPGRFHIVTEGSRLRLTSNGGLLPVDEVRKLLREEPERFSPNVLLRPLFQDSLLPTLAYVAGPNELAYFAQLAAVYRHFEVPMPLIVPRASFTILDKPHARFIRRYGVRFDELKANDESLLNRILKEQAPPQLEEDLSRARACIQEITQT
ncbi:MAG: bacillithiol biosynthesis cysteine-adding enzyme BshC, partial [Acidobacteriota bacterium]